MENKFDIKHVGMLELGARLNEINSEIDGLIIEYNDVIQEIKRRVPELENDENLKPKQKLKKLEW